MLAQLTVAKLIGIVAISVVAGGAITAISINMTQSQSVQIDCPAADHTPVNSGKETFNRVRPINSGAAKEY